MFLKFKMNNSKFKMNISKFKWNMLEMENVIGNKYNADYNYLN